MEYLKQKHPDEQLAIRKAVALKAAIDFSIGIWNVKGVEVTPDKALSDKVVNSVIEVADKFVRWLDVETNSSTPGEEITYPAPTLAQKEVLDEICKRTGQPENVIYPLALIWAKQVHNLDFYPSKMSSVQQIIDWNKRKQ